MVESGIAAGHKGRDVLLDAESVGVGLGEFAVGRIENILIRVSRIENNQLLQHRVTIIPT